MLAPRWRSHRRGVFVFKGKIDFMFEASIGLSALEAMESSDITGCTVTILGQDYPCTAAVLGIGDPFGPGGLSPNAKVVIVIRKCVLPDKKTFNTGNQLTLKRNLTSDSKALAVAPQGSRDLVLAWELTCQDVNQNA